ncbi:MAG TPA: aspartate carbamoyltransferase [Planctomycetia bacterium]|nr:aspartate carbamoyltransferase [Planctomycetia bacterium]
MNFVGSHILSIDQFALADVVTVFRTADELEPYARRRRSTRVLEGAILGNLFFEPSTRSRFSFGAAFERLGGSVREMTGFEYTSFAKGESIFDTARVMSGYVDALVVRHPEVGKVREFADATHVPVINSGDGTGEHPTQALLDLYTIEKELGVRISDLRGLKLAMVGDLRHGRTVHSLTKIVSLLADVDFRFVAPEALQMPGDIANAATSAGHRVLRTESLAEGVRDADVVYCTRLQEERFATRAEADRYRGMYSLNRASLETMCKRGVTLLHPLPRDSRVGNMELDSDLDDHPSLAVFRQADNGIAVRMALFALVLGVAERVHETVRDVSWYVPRQYGVRDRK